MVDLAVEKARERGAIASGSSAVPESTPQMSPSSASEHDRFRLEHSEELAHESVPGTSMEPPAPVQESPLVAPSLGAACASPTAEDLAELHA